MIQLSKSFFNKISRMINFYDKEAETIIISLDLFKGRDVKSICIAFYRALRWLDHIWGITVTVLII